MKYRDNAREAQIAYERNRVDVVLDDPRVVRVRKHAHQFYSSRPSCRASAHTDLYGASAIAVVSGLTYRVPHHMT